jgi:replicative DNA helicase
MDDGRHKSRQRRDTPDTGRRVNDPGYPSLRIPPQNLDAERALLGTLMLNSGAMYDVADVVHVDSFYSGVHRLIFDAMVTLYGKGTPVDVQTVAGLLKDRKQLEDVGGLSALAELSNLSVSPGVAKHYAEIVQTKSNLRKLIDAGITISELGFQEEREIESVLDEAERSIFNITQGSSVRKFSQLKDELAEAWERLERLQKDDGAMRGVPSGYPALDNMLSGFQKSDLIILAARPSMGKTALALDIARQTAVKHKTPVGIFSLEMSSQQLVDRMLASEAAVNSWQLRTGKIRKDEDFERLQRGIATLSEAPIYIDDQPGATILTMRSAARRLKSERNLGLIIVDYLQLIMPSDSRNNDNLVQQVTEISRSLKGMARELDVPVLALSQLSRAVEQRGGRPRLSDLRDSGSIEQDADVVMFIHREDMQGNRAENEKNGITEVLIEKHRNGPVGKVTLRFDDEKATFLSVDKSDFGDFVTETHVDTGGEDAPF